MWVGGVDLGSVSGNGLKFFNRSPITLKFEAEKLETESQSRERERERERESVVVFTFASGCCCILVS